MFLLMMDSSLRFGFHIAVQRGFTAQCKRGQRIHDDVDPEHLRDRQGRPHADERPDEGNQHGADIDGQLEDDKFPDVVVDGSAV